jgi:hypothetical protein
MKNLSIPVLLLAALVCGAAASLLGACADNANAPPPASASNATSTSTPPVEKGDGGGGW